MEAGGKKLGQLSLAILENFVEGTLGKKFVDELRAPTDRFIAIRTALDHTENRFKKEFADKDLAQAMFVDLPVDQTKLGEAVGKFYDHPTYSDFHQTLEDVLASEFKSLAPERIKAAVWFYIQLLKQEFALADVGFREKIRALADLETLEYVKKIERKLETRRMLPVEPHRTAPPYHIPEADRLARRLGIQNEGTSDMANKLKVFVCHGSGYEPVIEQLYDELIEAGFDPWLESAELLPGMDRSMEIETALRSSDAVIVCLSTISVKEEGRVQKDLKLAKDIQDEKPSGTIFRIPVRLDDCEIPLDLKPTEWVDYATPDGFERIVRSLNTRANQLGRQLGIAKKN